MIIITRNKPIAEQEQTVPDYNLINSISFAFSFY